jgi:Flp pilus assembly protein TadG
MSGMSTRLSEQKPARNRQRGAASRAIRLLNMILPADRAGNSVLQFALVAVVLFMLVFGITDLSRYFLAWHGLNTVVSEAARASMVNNKWTFGPGNPTSGIAATVASSAPFLDPNQMTLKVTSTTSNSITTVNVTAQYPFAFMLAPLSNANATLTSATQLSY